jgi:putative two-component system response regulator
MSTTPTPTSHRGRVLVVDDDADLRNTVVRFLQRRGYEVAEASSGPEGLVAVAKFRPGVMLLDINLPSMSGLEVLPEVLEVDPYVAIIMLTGAADATTATQCMRDGAVDFLIKPFALDRLASAIAEALRRRDTLAQDREITRWLKHEVALRTRELQEARRRQEELTVAALDALVNALEAKSPYFAGRAARVGDIAAGIATQLGLDEAEVEQIRLAGRLRDLGIIGIQEAILHKDGPLTVEEYAAVREHVNIATRILAPLTHLGPVVQYVQSHHERWDGQGYPEGRAAEEIPLGARIVGVAEAFDAITSPRPHKEPMASREALERIHASAGSAFDPTVVEALASAVEHRRSVAFVRGDGDNDVSPVPRDLGTSAPVP